MQVTLFKILYNSLNKCDCIANIYIEHKKMLLDFSILAIHTAVLFLVLCLVAAWSREVTRGGRVLPYIDYKSMCSCSGYGLWVGLYERPSNSGPHGCKTRGSSVSLSSRHKDLYSQGVEMAALAKEPGQIRKITPDSSATSRNHHDSKFSGIGVEPLYCGKARPSITKRVWFEGRG